MLNAFFEGLDMAEHHGRGGGNAHAVGVFHDLQPFICHAFFRAYDFAYPVDENLCPAAWYRVQSRLFEPCESFIQ